MIEILNEFPVILTKDKEWITEPHTSKPGSIVILPEDAVLVSRPITIIQEDL